jgi:hypothetical protein
VLPLRERARGVRREVVGGGVCVSAGEMARHLKAVGVARARRPTRRPGPDHPSPDAATRPPSYHSS